jgi:hypothetical protein
MQFSWFWSWRLVSAAQAFARAFSSEVATGLREENASKRKDKASF